MRVGILDCGVGNVTSLKNAIEYSGYSCEVVTSKNTNINTDILFIPGVGHFGFIMKQIKDHNYNELILNHYKQNKPLIGICIGMQVLFESSEEDQTIKGLGLLPGNIAQFKNEEISEIKPVHMGYNKVKFTSETTDWLKYSPNEEYFYFLHSYYAKDLSKITKNIGKTAYKNNDFCSFFKKDNIIGIQFHPERSGKAGLKFLKQVIDSFK